MAITADGNNKKVYHTSLGNFEETKPGVFISDTVDQKELVVPAETSINGAQRVIPVSAGTVIYTEIDLTQYKQTLDAALKPNAVPEAQADLMQTGSLVSEWVKASGNGNLTPQQVVNTYLMNASGAKNLAAEPVDQGPEAKGFNDDHQGLVRLSTKDPVQILNGFAGVADGQLNVPQAFLGSLKSYILGHEADHLGFKEKVYEGEDYKVLRAEIQADFVTLRSHFNKDFQDCVMDMRALGSMNNASAVDDHATHIWAEEYRGTDGTLPVKTEADQIMAAPAAIENRAVQLIAENMERQAGQTDADAAKEVRSNFSFAGERYGAYKAFRAKGAFDDIPYANEFVDKYLVAAERRYTPEVMAQSHLNEFKEFASAIFSDPAASPLAQTGAKPVTQTVAAPAI